MPLCNECLIQGYCRNKTVLVVNDAEIGNPKFVQTVREQIAALTDKTKDTWFSAGDLAELMHDLHGAFEGVFTQGETWRVELDMAELHTDVDDSDVYDLDDYTVCPRDETLRNWFRELAKPIPDDVRPYIHASVKERFRVVASILVASFPHVNWPRTVISNDNNKAANDNICKNNLYPPKRGGRGSM